jgi:predicted RNase H-like HicB family nuclease
VFDTVESGWVQARIAELPGVITVAPTIDEAKADLIDALHEYLASLAEPLDDNDASASGIRESVDLVIGS